MSTLRRRLRVPVAGFLLVLLVAPAAAACCLEMVEAMPCCQHGTEDVRLTLSCCVANADAAPASQPASPVAARADVHLELSTAPMTIALRTIDRANSGADSAAGPPGERLYLRLSVIRR